MLELSKSVRCVFFFVVNASGLELSSLTGQSENSTMNDEAVVQTAPENPVQKFSSSKLICNLFIFYTRYLRKAKNHRVLSCAVPRRAVSGG